MIPYVNSSFGIRILTRVHGSALYKSFLPALISTVIYITIWYGIGESEDLEALFIHPYPMQALVTAFTFLLVFRANYSYNRWWEAYTAVYLMHSKWLDLATEIAAFHYQSRRYDEYKPPSFGANPGVQSLDTCKSEISIVHGNMNIRMHDEFFETSTTGVEGSFVDASTSSNRREKNVMTPPTSPRKLNRAHMTPTGRTRHARKATLTDLIEQMDACEAEEAAMKRQSLMPEESEESDDNNTDEGMDEGFVDIIEKDFEKNSEEIDSERGEGGIGIPRERNKRSWLQKIRDKRSEAKAQRMTKKQEKGREADELAINFSSIATVSRHSGHVNSSREHQKQKSKRRRTRHAAAKRQPATARLFKERKSIATKNGRSIRQECNLEFCDRFDVHTGLPYSVFTAVSRKHLREGNLDPDEVPPLLFLEECAHLLSLMSAVAFSTLRNDLPEAESPLTVFEPGLPWPLVDPDGYKAKVRKGWTQSKSRLYSVLQFALGRSRNDHARTLYNAARPFRVIGNVSDAEIEKLQEARGPLAKVSLISMWLLELISREYQAGSTGAVAAPIISRLYQFVSEGLAGYNQARKIAYIPFPFPHAQITTLYLLVVDFLVTPLLMTTFVTNFTLGLVLNLFSVLCFTGLHEVAREIENPFLNIPNDVPLNNYQAQFNEGLMVMFYGYHPDAYWSKKQKYNENDTGATPDIYEKNHSCSPNAPIRRKNGDRSPHVRFQKEDPPDGRTSPVSNSAQHFSDALSQSSTPRTTNNESFCIPKNDGLSIKQPRLESPYIESMKFKERENLEGGSGLNEGNNSGIVMRASGANNSMSSNVVADIGTDKFLHDLMGTMPDSSSTIASFRRTLLESDSDRQLSDDQKGAPSGSVLFRIPRRTIDNNAGVKLERGQSDSSIIFSNERAEEKDLVSRHEDSP